MRFYHQKGIKIYEINNRKSYVETEIGKMVGSGNQGMSRKLLFFSQYCLPFYSSIKKRIALVPSLYPPLHLAKGVCVSGHYRN
jgi:hypothetical protein